MAGDHACPVCGSRFTRPQHVTRHMRSHTGDRPYKCTQCGDQFARSDLLSRHVNKCHSGTPATAAARAKKEAHVAANSNRQLSRTNVPCDQCTSSRQQCDYGSPCGKCIQRKAPCTFMSRAGSTTSSISSARRSSLPSANSQQPTFSYGSQNTNGVFSNQPYNPSLLANEPFIFSQYASDSGTNPSNLSGLTAQPVPMPNGQYIGMDQYSLYSSVDPLHNNIPSSSNAADIASLFERSSHQLPLTLAGGRQNSKSRFESSNALADSISYLQQRRGSQNGSGHVRNYSDSYQLAPLQSQYPNLENSEISYGRGSFSQSSPGSSFGNKQLDGSRVNERLSAIRGAANIAFSDDGSSVSDFGSGSGAPSPVPSGTSGFEGSQTQPSSDAFASNHSNAVPLPTPLQLNSFNTFQTSNGPLGSDRTPGSGEGKSSSALYPPYQSFEHMNLEEAASFAAAAKNAANAGVYTGTPSIGENQYGTWHPGHYNASSLGPPTYSQTLLSAGGKERAINELKDFWAAFISEPLTTGNGNGVRSDNSGSSSGSTLTLTKKLSMPTLKTPMASESSERTSLSNSGSEMNHPTPRVLYPNGHSYILGMTFKDSPAKSAQGGKAITDVVGPVAPPSTDDPESLRKYQEACLKRDPPMLRLQPRSKSRVIGASTSPQSKLPLLESDGTSEAIMNTRNFVAPFPPGSKEARDWNFYRAQAQAQVDIQKATSELSTNDGSSRPSYKRLPSQTLGPENTKRARDSSAIVDGDGELTSSERPAANQSFGANGAQSAAWMRHRSVSSPTSIRPNIEWQAIGPR